MKNKITKLVSAIMVGTMFITFSCKKPAASFTADKSTAKVGETVTFTNASTKDSKDMWDFGDGTQSLSSQNTITHVYEKAGTYNVTLMVSKKNGKKESDAPATVITISEDKNPKALFTSKTTVVTGEIVAFTSTSTDADQLAWDFGDGYITTASPVQTHVYNTAGVYVVTLTAFAKNSTLRNTYSSTITVGGTNGDNATQAMLYGQWKMTSHTLVHTWGGATVDGTCNNIGNQPFSVTSFTSTPKIEVRPNGSIYSYDGNGNISSTSGSWNLKDATKFNSWAHSTLEADGSGTLVVNTAVPSFNVGNPWTITTLNATTLVITSSYSDTNRSGFLGAACTPSNTTVVRAELATEVVTYTKL